MTRYRLDNAREKARAAYAVIQAPDGWICELKEPTRNSADEDDCQEGTDV